jgi:hypothetical protein
MADESMVRGDSAVDDNCGWLSADHERRRVCMSTADERNARNATSKRSWKRQRSDQNSVSAILCSTLNDKETIKLDNPNQE